MLWQKGVKCSRHLPSSHDSISQKSIVSNNLQNPIVEWFFEIRNIYIKKQKSFDPGQPARNAQADLG